MCVLSIALKLGYISYSSMFSVVLDFHRLIADSKLMLISRRHKLNITHLHFLSPQCYHGILYSEI